MLRDEDYKDYWDECLERLPDPATYPNDHVKVVVHEPLELDIELMPHVLPLAPHLKIRTFRRGHKRYGRGYWEPISVWGLPLSEWVDDIGPMPSAGVVAEAALNKLAAQGRDGFPLYDGEYREATISSPPYYYTVGLVAHLETHDIFGWEEV